MNNLLRCITRDKQQPRVLLGHHEDDCTLNDCEGCRPCTEHHCTSCGREHVDTAATYVCPTCLHDVRESISSILMECAALPNETIIKGVDSEAFNMHGPAANPEAWGHTLASIAVGRLDAEWVEYPDNELHPMWVLVKLEMEGRDLLEQDAPPEVGTVGASARWLLRNLHAIAAHPDNDFAEVSTQVHACLSHLKALLHSGEQRDTGAPCPTCGRSLTKRWIDRTSWDDDQDQPEWHDGWECSRCNYAITDAEYRLTVLVMHRENADWLTDKEAEAATGINRSTIRSLARRGTIATRLTGQRHTTRHYCTRCLNQHASGQTPAHNTHRERDTA